jgi:hypothetical protein
MPLLENVPLPTAEKIDPEAVISEKKPESPPPASQAEETKDAPPSYVPQDPNPEGPSVEELNAAFASLDLKMKPPSFPTEDNCLAHLKLLAVFHNLKEDIGYADGMFNLYDAKCEMADERDKSLMKMREKRWALYIARAVERFEAWWLNVLCSMEESKRLEGKEMVATCIPYKQFTQRGCVQTWTAEMLPPVGKLPSCEKQLWLIRIDVLMVWHAFMLNPRSYLEDCIRFGLKDLWATGMPWPVVNAAIDTSFNYTAPETAMKDFTARTGYQWKNEEDSLIKKVSCPRCNQELHIPWTTCCQSEKTAPQE